MMSAQNTQLNTVGSSPQVYLTYFFIYFLTLCDFKINLNPNKLKKESAYLAHDKLSLATGQGHRWHVTATLWKDQTLVMTE